MGPDDIQQLLSLSAAERLRLAEQLWNSVSEEIENAPLTAQERAFVGAQLTEYRANPDDTVSWASVKKSLGL